MNHCWGPMAPDGTDLQVALIGGYSPDTAHFSGGVQAATGYLLKGLAKIDGLELHILALRPPAWAGPDRFNQNGMCVHLLPPYPRFERLRGYRVYQSILDRALAQIQPAVVHAQEASSDAFVATRSGFRTVVTAHGIRAEDVKYVRSWRRRLRFYFDSALIERSVMRRVKYLIAISQYVTVYFAALLRPDIHLNYIPNAIDERFFKLGDNSNKPVILYAGRVIPRKRVLDLVQAVAQVTRQVPQVELRIAGEFASEPAYVAEVRGFIQQAGLSERVHLLGELCEENLLQEYRACKLVALPSSQETAPMVLAQAMAAAKPVVSTRVGGVVEMVGQDGERGLLTDVGNVGGLAAAITGLLQNPAQCALLGQAGHAFALENYHLDRVAQRTFETYQHIAAAERRPGA
jgi:glycosyltransferase involved in cell wall biosynthesis